MGEFLTKNLSIENEIPFIGFLLVYAMNLTCPSEMALFRKYALLSMIYVKSTNHYMVLLEKFKINQKEKLVIIYFSEFSQ